MAESSTGRQKTHACQLWRGCSSIRYSIPPLAYLAGESVRAGSMIRPRSNGPFL